MKPFLDLRLSDGSRSGRQQVLRQELEELRGGHALKRVLIEPLAEKAIEGVAPELVFEKRKKQCTQLVRNHGIGIVRIAIAQRGLERSIAGDGEVRARLCEIAKTDDALHVREPLAIDDFDNAALEVGGESLVEPEVLPGGVGHEVARP